MKNAEKSISPAKALLMTFLMPACAAFWNLWRFGRNPFWWSLGWSVLIGILCMPILVAVAWAFMKLTQNRQDR